MAVGCLWRPVQIATRDLADLRSDLRQFVLEERPEAIIFEHHTMAQYRAGLPSESFLKILSIHNNEADSLLECMRCMHFGIRKLVYLIEALRMRRFERQFFTKHMFDDYVFVSSLELQRYVEQFPSIRTRAHLIHPVEIFQPSKEEKIPPDGSKWIVFTGTMRYPPNVDAAEWFGRDVFPLILKREPGCKFVLVGRDPDQRLLQMAKANPAIVITGAVKAVFSYLERADLIVIPVRRGTGVKIKLFEALGQGKLVVATKKAIEGTPFQAGEHLVVAGNSAYDFAEKCILALTSPQAFAHLGAAGQRRLRLLLDSAASSVGVVELLDRELRCLAVSKA